MSATALLEADMESNGRRYLTRPPVHRARNGNTCASDLILVSPTQTIALPPTQNPNASRPRVTFSESDSLPTNVIYSTLGRIIDHTDDFVNRLLVAARAEADVPLGDLLADLATDVIGSCVVAHEMGCQTSAEGEREKGPNGLFTCLRDSVALQPQLFGSGLSASVRRVLAKRKLKHYQRTLDTRIISIIQLDTKAGFAAKYIGSDPWTPSLLRQCVDQFKTVILAGQDTTAVIKETLRLRGISGTTRELAKEVLIDVDGEKVPLETGAICYVNNFLLMKNLEYWGMDAEDFRPSHFLEGCENNKEPGGGGLDQRSPRMRHIAYRSFERGPRNCIGQELSMLEMRIVLALTVRRFNFFKKGFDGVHEEEVYDISRVVHSPVDRMKMRFEDGPASQTRFEVTDHQEDTE